MTDEQFKNEALCDIEEIMTNNGQSLASYPLKPSVIRQADIGLKNQLIFDELNYDQAALAGTSHILANDLNEEQNDTYLAILKSCSLDLGHLFFVYGGGGTGKTYLWRALIFTPSK